MRDMLFVGEYIKKIMSIEEIKKYESFVNDKHMLNKVRIDEIRRSN